MIPTIEDIVRGLIEGHFTEAQAIAWLHQHAAPAIDATLDDRRMFAAMAMQGLCLNTNAYHERGPHNEAIATRAVALADALLTCLHSGRDQP